MYKQDKDEVQSTFWKDNFSELYSSREEENESQDAGEENNDESQSTSEGEDDEIEGTCEEENDESQSSREQENDDDMDGTCEENDESESTGEENDESESAGEEMTQESHLTNEQDNHDSQFAREQETDESESASQEDNDDDSYSSEENDELQLTCVQENSGDSHVTDSQILCEEESDESQSSSEQENDESQITCEQENDESQITSEKEDDESQITSEQENDESQGESEEENDDSQSASEEINEGSQVTNEQDNYFPGKQENSGDSYSTSGQENNEKLQIEHSFTGKHENDEESHHETQSPSEQDHYGQSDWQSEFIWPQEDDYIPLDIPFHSSYVPETDYEGSKSLSQDLNTHEVAYEGNDHRYQALYDRAATYEKPVPSSRLTFRNVNTDNPEPECYFTWEQKQPVPQLQSIFNSENGYKELDFQSQSLHGQVSEFEESDHLFPTTSAQENDEEPYPQLQSTYSPGADCEESAPTLKSIDLMPDPTYHSTGEQENWYEQSVPLSHDIYNPDTINKELISRSQTSLTQETYTQPLPKSRFPCVQSVPLNHFICTQKLTGISYPKLISQCDPKSINESVLFQMEFASELENYKLQIASEQENDKLQIASEQEKDESQSRCEENNGELHYTCVQRRNHETQSIREQENIDDFQSLCERENNYDPQSPCEENNEVLQYTCEQESHDESKNESQFSFNQESVPESHFLCEEENDDPRSTIDKENIEPQSSCKEMKTESQHTYEQDNHGFQIECEEEDKEELQSAAFQKINDEFKPIFEPVSDELQSTVQQENNDVSHTTSDHAKTEKLQQESKPTSEQDHFGQLGCQSQDIWHQENEYKTLDIHSKSIHDRETEHEGSKPLSQNENSHEIAHEGCDPMHHVISDQAAKYEETDPSYTLTCIQINNDDSDNEFNFSLEKERWYDQPGTQVQSISNNETDNEESDLQSQSLWVHETEDEDSYYPLTKNTQKNDETYSLIVGREEPGTTMKSIDYVPDSTYHFIREQENWDEPSVPQSHDIRSPDSNNRESSPRSQTSHTQESYTELLHKTQSHCGPEMCSNQSIPATGFVCNEKPKRKSRTESTATCDRNSIFENVYCQSESASQEENDESQITLEQESEGLQNQLEENIDESPLACAQEMDQESESVCDQGNEQSQSSCEENNCELQATCNDTNEESQFTGELEKNDESQTEPQFTFELVSESKFLSGNDNSKSLREQENDDSRSAGEAISGESQITHEQDTFDSGFVCDQENNQASHLASNEENSDDFHFTGNQENKEELQTEPSFTAKQENKQLNHDYKPAIERNLYGLSNCQSQFTWHQETDWRALDTQCRPSCDQETDYERSNPLSLDQNSKESVYEGSDARYQATADQEATTLTCKQDSLDNPDPECHFSWCEQPDSQFQDIFNNENRYNDQLQSTYNPADDCEPTNGQENNESQVTSGQENNESQVTSGQENDKSQFENEKENELETSREENNELHFACVQENIEQENDEIQTISEGNTCELQSACEELQYTCEQENSDVLQTEPQFIFKQEYFNVSQFSCDQKIYKSGFTNEHENICESQSLNEQNEFLNVCEENDELHLRREEINEDSRFANKQDNCDSQFMSEQENNDELHHECRPTSEEDIDEPSDSQSQLTWHQQKDYKSLDMQSKSIDKQKTDHEGSDPVSLDQNSKDIVHKGSDCQYQAIVGQEADYETSFPSSKLTCKEAINEYPETECPITWEQEHCHEQPDPQFQEIFSNENGCKELSFTSQPLYKQETECKESNNVSPTRSIQENDEALRPTTHNPPGDGEESATTLESDGYMLDPTSHFIKEHESWYAQSVPQYHDMCSLEMNSKESVPGSQKSDIHENFSETLFQLQSLCDPEIYVDQSIPPFHYICNQKPEGASYPESKSTCKQKSHNENVCFETEPTNKHDGKSQIAGEPENYESRLKYENKNELQTSWEINNEELHFTCVLDNSQESRSLCENEFQPSSEHENISESQALCVDNVFQNLCEENDEMQSQSKENDESQSTCEEIIDELKFTSEQDICDFQIVCEQENTDGTPTISSQENNEDLQAEPSFTDKQENEEFFHESKSTSEQDHYGQSDCQSRSIWHHDNDYKASDIQTKSIYDQENDDEEVNRLSEDQNTKGIIYEGSDSQYHSVCDQAVKHEESPTLTRKEAINDNPEIECCSTWEREHKYELPDPQFQSIFNNNNNYMESSVQPLSLYGQESELEESNSLFPTKSIHANDEELDSQLQSTFNTVSDCEEAAPTLKSSDYMPGPTHDTMREEEHWFKQSIPQSLDVCRLDRNDSESRPESQITHTQENKTESLPQFQSLCDQGIYFDHSVPLSPGICTQKPNKTYPEPKTKSDPKNMDEKTFSLKESTREQKSYESQNVFEKENEDLQTLCEENIDEMYYTCIQENSKESLPICEQENEENTYKLPSTYVDTNNELQYTSEQESSDELQSDPPFTFDHECFSRFQSPGGKENYEFQSVDEHVSINEESGSLDDGNLYQNRCEENGEMELPPEEDNGLQSTYEAIIDESRFTNEQENCDSQFMCEHENNDDSHTSSDQENSEKLQSESSFTAKHENSEELGTQFQFMWYQENDYKDLNTKSKLISDRGNEYEGSNSLPQDLNARVCEGSETQYQAICDQAGKYEEPVSSSTLTWEEAINGIPDAEYHITREDFQSQSQHGQETEFKKSDNLYSIKSTQDNDEELYPQLQSTYNPAADCEEPVTTLSSNDYIPDTIYHFVEQENWYEHPVTQFEARDPGRDQQVSPLQSITQNTRDNCFKLLTESQSLHDPETCFDHSLLVSQFICTQNPSGVYLESKSKCDPKSINDELSFQIQSTGKENDGLQTSCEEENDESLSKCDENNDELRFICEKESVHESQSLSEEDNERENYEWRSTCDQDNADDSSSTCEENRDELHSKYEQEKNDESHSSYEDTDEEIQHVCEQEKNDESFPEDQRTREENTHEGHFQLEEHDESLTTFEQRTDEYQSSLKKVNNDESHSICERENYDYQFMCEGDSDLWRSTSKHKDSQEIHEEFQSTTRQDQYRDSSCQSQFTWDQENYYKGLDIQPLTLYDEGTYYEGSDFLSRGLNTHENEYEECESQYQAAKYEKPISTSKFNYSKLDPKCQSVSDQEHWYEQPVTQFKSIYNNDNNYKDSDFQPQLLCAGETPYEESYQSRNYNKESYSQFQPTYNLAADYEDTTLSSHLSDYHAQPDYHHIRERENWYEETVPQFHHTGYLESDSEERNPQYQSSQLQGIYYEPPPKF